LASCASSAYKFALTISALNSLQFRLLSFGPIPLITVGVAQELQIKKNSKLKVNFYYK